MNEAGYELIRKYEAFKDSAYLCPAGKWTIGYGHTKDVKKGDTCSISDAENLLKRDCEIVENHINDVVLAPLTDNQRSALVSFVFNIGNGNFDKSTLLKVLNRGWYDQVPVELSKWIYIKKQQSGGLARRRIAEIKLWNT